MKEKLIEILKQAEEATPCALDPGVDCKGKRCVDCVREASADRLIASGVVVSKMETTTRWIPVTERLPERDGKYLCNYHFGEHRNRTFTQVLDYYATDKAPHFQHENSYGMKVSHWMPLPAPPKGE